MIRTILFLLISMNALMVNSVQAGGNFSLFAGSEKSSWLRDSFKKLTGHTSQSTWDSVWNTITGKKPETAVERALKQAKILPNSLALYAKEHPIASLAIVSTPVVLYGAYNHNKKRSLFNETSDMPGRTIDNAIDDMPELDEGDNETLSITTNRKTVSDVARDRVKRLGIKGKSLGVSSKTALEVTRMIKRDSAQRRNPINIQSLTSEQIQSEQTHNDDDYDKVDYRLPSLQKTFVRSNAQTNDDEAMIASRINTGKRVLNTLFNTTHEVKNTPQDAQAIIWALFSLAEEKEQAFQEGIFVVEDPERRLFKYLTGQGGAYNRISTHYKKFKDASQEYGADVSYEGKFELPEGKGTMLVGYLADRGVVYIKPENYGLGTWYNWTMHAVETVGSVARKVAPSVFGSNDQHGFRKEHIPADVLKMWNNTVTTLQQSEFITQDEAQEAAALGKKYGICAMYNRLNAWRMQEGKEVAPEVQSAIQSVDTMLKGYDNKAIRQGNEVIFTLAELQEPLGLDDSAVPLESKKIDFKVDPKKESWGTRTAQMAAASASAAVDTAYYGARSAYDWYYGKDELTDIRAQVQTAIASQNVKELDAVRPLLFRYLQRTDTQFGATYEQSLQRGLTKFDVDPQTGVYELLGLDSKKDATVDEVTNAIQAAFKQPGNNTMKLRQLTFIFGMDEDDASVNPFSLRLYNAYRTEGAAGVDEFKLTQVQADELHALLSSLEDAKLELLS